MDTISNAELIELTFNATEHIHAQFQFWLSITFALIAACFIARDQLSSRLRIVLAILYISTTLLIYFRLFSAGSNTIRMTNEILARGIQWTAEATQWLGLYQTGIIVFGSCAALWFLYSTYRGDGTYKTNPVGGMHAGGSLPLHLTITGQFFIQLSREMGMLPSFIAHTCAALCIA